MRNYTQNRFMYALLMDFITLNAQGNGEATYSCKMNE